MNVLSSPEQTLNILLIDDNVEVCRAFARLVKTLDTSVRVHTTTTEDKAIKKLENETYKLIFIDLRLSPKQPDEGLKLLRQLAPTYPKSTFILFTANPYDPIIRQAIEKTNEQEANFPLFVGNKADANKLMSIAEGYLRVQPTPTINYSILPAPLLNQLQEIGQTLWNKEVNRAYEYGELLYQAKIAIENRRQELDDQLTALDSAVNKTDQKRREALSEERQELSKLWADWLSPYINLARSQIGKYVAYYEYFKDPQRYPHRTKFDVESFTVLTRRQGRGRGEAIPLVLSDADQKYLLETTEDRVPRKQVEAYVKLKKASRDLPPPILYRLSQESSSTLDHLIKHLVQTTLDARQLEKLLEQSQQEDIGSKLLSALKPSVTTSELDSSQSRWQFKGYYSLFRGNWQTGISKLNKPLGCVVIEHKLSDFKLHSDLFEQNVQVITLRSMDIDDFVYLFEDIIGRIKPYLPKDSVMVFYVSQKILTQIDETLSNWQTPQSIEPEDRQFFEDLLTDLSKKQDLYLITT